MCLLSLVLVAGRDRNTHIVCFSLFSFLSCLSRPSPCRRHANSYCYCERGFIVFASHRMPLSSSFSCFIISFASCLCAEPLFSFLSLRFRSYFFEDHVHSFFLVLLHFPVFHTFSYFTLSRFSHCLVFHTFSLFRTVLSLKVY